MSVDGGGCEVAVKRDGHVFVAADAVLDGFGVFRGMDERLPRVNVLGLVEIAVGNEGQALGRGRGPWPVQEPQRGWAMITARGAKLIEEARLVRTTGARIAAGDAGQGLAFGRPTQVRCLGNHEGESMYRQTPRPPPSPGNI